MIEAKGVWLKSVVATHMAFQTTIGVEFNLPERSPRRIRNKKITVSVEGKSIGDEILSGRTCCGGLRRLQALILSAHALA